MSFLQVLFSYFFVFPSVKFYNVITVNSLQCVEEAHRPVDCGTVAKWIMKNSAESENMNWYVDAT